MQTLLRLSRTIDWVTMMIGRGVAWLIVVAAVISAGNAIIRKLFDSSSNAWLESQWWLFSIAFLLAAPWTLAQNEHIRIDILNNRLSARTRDLIDVIGHAFFLLPMTLLLVWTSWDFFWKSYDQNEQSWNAGGLAQWPIKAIIPIAFALLFLQALSELIKRVAIMTGAKPRKKIESTYHSAAAGRNDTPSTTPS